MYSLKTAIRLKCVYFRVVLYIRANSCLPEDICNTFSFIIILGLPLVSSGQRSWILLNIPWCSGQVLSLPTSTTKHYATQNSSSTKFEKPCPKRILNSGTQRVIPKKCSLLHLIVNKLKWSKCLQIWACVNRSCFIQPVEQDSNEND